MKNEKIKLIKSDKEQLEKRGFLPREFSVDSYDLSFAEKLKLLQSKIPTDRTLSARLLIDEIDVDRAVESLVKVLVLEKKLHPKIEMSNTLISFGESSVKPLIELLGQIGSNQHKTVPTKEFRKDSYPLPRDIASRILGYIGKVAIPELISSFNHMSVEQKSEAIDAIGFICFYDHHFEAYEILNNC